MTAADAYAQNELFPGHMRWPAICSAILHVVMFALATFGIPYIASKPEPVEMAIAVELVDASDIPQSLPKDDANDEPPVPIQRKPLYSDSDTVPDLLSPRKPDIKVDDIPEPPKKDEPLPEKAEIKMPPKPVNKPRPPEKPKPKQEETKEPEKVAEPEKDFNSLLKSLTPDEVEPSPKLQAEAKESNNQEEGQSVAMTSGEIDDLNRGVQPCWNVNAGGRNAEDLIVTLRVFVNPDLRVRDVQIIDQLRYSTDTHFKAAAEAARRALLNPNCSKLNLPPEKYEQWKVFRYVFDPSQML
ncbi:MAG: hypothetical protein GC137_10155 [Alphaproteobacteria bacterium]|nr:hypothetical protein [Alphaproteobacteria bacterium]